MGLSNFNPSTGRVVKKQFTLNMRVVILLAVVAAAVCDFVPVPFDTCDKIDVVTAVALEPCEKVGGLCPLVRGKNVTLQLKFTVRSDSSGFLSRSKKRTSAVKSSASHVRSRLARNTLCATCYTRKPTSRPSASLSNGS